MTLYPIIQRYHFAPIGFLAAVAVFWGGCATPRVTSSSFDTHEERYAYWIARGDRAFEAGNFEAARRSYEKAENHEQTADIAVKVGDTFYGLDKRQKAQRAYEIAIARNPNVLGARSGLARLELSSRYPDVEQALKLLDEEETLQPGRPIVAVLRDDADTIIKTRKEQERAKQEEATQQVAAERQENEALARLQSQSYRIGTIVCQYNSYEVVGDEIGNELAYATANGTFVAIVLKCLNVGKKTQQVNSPDFNLRDNLGRQYEVDATGSYYFMVTNAEGTLKTPNYLQLHPGVVTFIGLIFDVPPSVAKQPGLALDFRGAKYQLVLQ